MRLFEYDSKVKNRPWPKKVVDGVRRMVSYISKQFGEDGEHGYSIWCGNIGVVTLRNVPVRASSRPWLTPFKPFISENYLLSLFDLRLVNRGEKGPYHRKLHHALALSVYVRLQPLQRQSGWLGVYGNSSKWGKYQPESMLFGIFTAASDTYWHHLYSPGLGTMLRKIRWTFWTKSG